MIVKLHYHSLYCINTSAEKFHSSSAMLRGGKEEKIYIWFRLYMIWLMVTYKYYDSQHNINIIISSPTNTGHQTPMLSGKYLPALKQMFQIWKKFRRFKTGFINKLLNVALILAIILVMKTLIRIVQKKRRD